jgi:hypothetical protein
MTIAREIHEAGALRIPGAQADHVANGRGIAGAAPIWRRK